MKEDKEKKAAKKIFFKKWRKKLNSQEKYKISKSEKNVIKRIEKKKKEEVAKKSEKKHPNKYAGAASRIFSDFSRPLVESKNFFRNDYDLLKTNLGFVPPVYISVIFLSVFISFVVAFGYIPLFLII